MTMTNHGEARIKERSGIGKSARKMERLANNALLRGYHHKETKGPLRRYLDGRYLRYEGGNNMRIYAGQLFVFEGDRLITVFPLPSKYQKNLERYIRKEEDVV